MESMKSQAPSTKLQINLKFQYQMTKTGLVRRRRIGYCNLFDMCDLEFGIFGHSSTPKELAPVPAKPLNSDLALRTRFSMLNQVTFTE